MAVPKDEISHCRNEQQISLRLQGSQTSDFPVLAGFVSSISYGEWVAYLGIWQRSPVVWSSVLVNGLSAFLLEDGWLLVLLEEINIYKSVLLKPVKLLNYNS